MQTLPQTDRKHLGHDAALILLAVLPERIRDAYLNYAKQIDYSIEMVVDRIHTKSAICHREIL